MKRLKHLILLCLLLLLGLPAMAQSRLVVYLNDGSKAGFLLAETPKVTFSADSLSIVSSTSDIELSRADVRTFKFDDEKENEDNTGITTPREEAAFNIVDNTVTISGIDNGIRVAVYSIDGQVVLTATAIDGSCSLSLDNLAKGIYLINYNTTTIKFLKK